MKECDKRKSHISSMGFWVDKQNQGYLSCGNTEHDKGYGEKENKIHTGSDIFNEIQEKHNEFLMLLILVFENMLVWCRKPRTSIIHVCYSVYREFYETERKREFSFVCAAMRDLTMLLVGLLRHTVWAPVSVISRISDYS
jgi:hypothetical protein